MLKRDLIIAIDGPSAAGKSTLGKALARKYSLVYIDTGAMYRAVAWLARCKDIDWTEEASLVEIVESKPIRISLDDDLVRVWIDDEEVTDSIRTPEIGSGASQISALPGVKRAMIKKQQNMGERGGVVMDGRDIGTFVFPRADYKFYLDASLEIRAMRRFMELKAKGLKCAGLDNIVDSMRIRDYNDTNRSVAPLMIAQDAMVINTDKLCISDVLAVMVKRIEQPV